MTPRRGFTLIEFCIELVTIGLIIGLGELRDILLGYF